VLTAFFERLCYTFINRTILSDIIISTRAFDLETPTRHCPNPVMSSPATIAGIVIASIAGLFAVLAPFIIILLRRRRTSLQLQGHGAASFVWSHFDGAAEYGKSFVDFIALLEHSEQECEDLSTRPYTTTGRHALLVDLSSAYGYGHIARNQMLPDAVINKACSSPSDVVSSSISSAATERTESAETIALSRGAQQGSTNHDVRDSRLEEEVPSSTTVIADTSNTLIDISVDEISTTHLQKRAEMTTEVLNEPMNHGSARSKFAAYTPGEYETALLEAATLEQVSASVSQTTKKVVRKRSEYSEVALNGPVNHGSTRSKFAAYTPGDYEATLMELALSEQSTSASVYQTTKRLVHKRSEHSEEGLNGSVNFGSEHVRGTRHIQGELERH
jgi:hypothetical protein